MNHFPLLLPDDAAKYYLAAIVESSTDSIISVDFDGIITSWNKAAAKLYGYETSEAIGKPLKMLLMSGDMQFIVDSIERIKRSKTVERFDTVRIKKSGKQIELEIEMSPVKNIAGEVIGVSTIARDITERKRTENALRESEERYQSFIRQSSEGIWRFEMGVPVPVDLPVAEQIDLVFRYAYLAECNDAMARMYGYDKSKELIGRHISEFMPRDADTEAFLTHFIESGYNATGAESKELDRYGKTKYFMNNLLGIIQHGAIRRAWGNQRDITAQKLAEETLREQEQRFRILADALPHIIWTARADGSATYFNQRWYEFTGITGGQSPGPGWQTIVHPDDAEEATERWQKSLITGEEFNSELRLRRHDGAYCWFIVRDMPLRDGSGRITAWFGSATDINDLKRAQQSHAKSEQRQRVTMNSAVDYAIITTDVAGTIDGWSSGAARIFGYTEDEALGRSVHMIFTPEDVAAGVPEGEMQTALQEGRALDERWHVRSDGTRFYMSGSTHPIFDPVHAGFVKVARDMTEQKLQEQLKDEFIGIASHELRTPVASIKAYVELLEDMFVESGDKTSADMMQKLDGQIDRLTGLIHSMLDVTRASHGRLDMYREHFRLDELLPEVVEDMQAGTQQELVVEHTHAVGVFADRKRIAQVLANLISNAVKYAPGSDRVLIRMAMRSDATVLVCVQDFGIGMSEEVRTRVFDRFYRANEGIGNTYPGLGLGLFISSEIIRQHGGDIWVDSVEGKGSVFCFTLPVDNGSSYEHRKITESNQ